jgi:hypothetical protein
MSTATLMAAARADATATLAEQQATTRARATYHRVMNAEWPGHVNRDKIRGALDGITEALETYTAILDGAIHPASAYCELEHEDDAYDRALSMTAADAADWADELDRLVPEETEGERAA